MLFCTVFTLFFAVWYFFVLKLIDLIANPAYYNDLSGYIREHFVSIQANCSIYDESFIQIDDFLEDF